MVKHCEMQVGGIDLSCHSRLAKSVRRKIKVKEHYVCVVNKACISSVSKQT